MGPARGVKNNFGIIYTNVGNCAILLVFGPSPDDLIRRLCLLSMLSDAPNSLGKIEGLFRMIRKVTTGSTSLFVLGDLKWARNFMLETSRMT
jgi:hypothetical protein